MRSIGRVRSDSSPVRVNVPSCAASRPDSRRISVPELPASTGPSGSRSPRSPTPRTRTRSTSSSSTSTPSARRASSVDSVSAALPKPAMRVSPSLTAPISAARCEIDLSPGTRMWPTRADAGSTRVTASRARARRRRRSPAPRAARPRARGGLGARDEHGQVATPLGRHVLELEVLDVDPRRAERLRDRRPAPRGGRGRGRAAAGGRPGRGNASESSRRRLEDASPIQRARKPPSRARRACSSWSTRRRWSASDAVSASAFSRKMSTQIRGFAPATRVSSRSEPPAAASGSWPFDARLPGLVDRAGSRARAGGGS